jgi:hypothetical protein
LEKVLSALSVAHVNGEFSVLAARPFAQGETLLTLEGELSDRPTRYSLQIDWELHIAVSEALSLEEMLGWHPWRFLNHGCDANAMVRGRDLVAVRPIDASEEITFNYNSTEFDMASAFACRCGSPACEGVIRGFKYLSLREQERLRPLLSAHLLAVL